MAYDGATPSPRSLSSVSLSEHLQTVNTLNPHVVSLAGTDGRARYGVRPGKFDRRKKPARRDERFFSEGSLGSACERLRCFARAPASPEQTHGKQRYRRGFRNAIYFNDA